MEQNLIELQKHCFRLSRFLFHIDEDQFAVPIDWLDIASAIENVEMMTGKYDIDWAMCSLAMAYEDKRSALFTAFTTQLVLFNFVWGSFEGIVEAIDLPNSQSGKAGGSRAKKATLFLKERYAPNPPVAFYNEQVSLLRRLVQNNGLEKKLKNYFEISPKNQETLNSNGIGLHVVREIRNDHAHGSAMIPVPVDWDKGHKILLPAEKQQCQLIETSTRIVLLTIQMILLAHLSGKRILMEYLQDDHGESLETTAEVALHVLHIEPCPIDHTQTPLFDYP